MSDLSRNLPIAKAMAENFVNILDVKTAYTYVPRSYAGGDGYRPIDPIYTITFEYCFQGKNKIEWRKYAVQSHAPTLVDALDEVYQTAKAFKGQMEAE